MRPALTASLLLAIAVALVPAASSGAAVRARGSVSSLPSGFFGISPQTALTPRDALYMKAGGIESVRLPLVWSSIQPTAHGGYNWSGVDQAVEVAARAGLSVLPTVSSTPRWLAPKSTTLPVQTERQREAWAAFLQAAVDRYGPGGTFWVEHSHEGIDYEPAIGTPTPIRTWQIWNEPNFFYSAYPVSPSRYAKLVKNSSKAIREIEPSANVILAGLFGKPTAGGARGMPAARFLSDLYRVPGLSADFDGIALHPYAADTQVLEELVEAFHQVTVRNHDRVPMYITEMGWGSANDFRHDAFEQGIRGQVSELRGAYGYLIANQRRLDLQQVDWFSWKDVKGACNFCDSVGFFHEGAGFRPKPAWRAFVAITGGRSRP
ncbi:MAG: beta-galactosidase [Solirubrobacterales bacterium]